MVATNGEHKFLVIIDEFDDLDPAFYTGERGKQFVKALRSVSEAGLTFFFVGSERMDAIYSRHQSDLNKWTNIRLDRIDSRADCRALIAEPVAGVIEFASEAIDFITDYTAGNPFYIHNFCYKFSSAASRNTGRSLTTTIRMLFGRSSYVLWGLPTFRTFGKTTQCWTHWRNAERAQRIA